jgi:DNA-3-methyladenine glycosylase II
VDVELDLTPQGPFSLEAAAGFGFGPTEGRAPAWDGTLRLAFPVDGGRGHAGAVLRQREPDGPVSVELELRSGAEPGAALAQVARILSLDHDGAAFQRLGESDRVLGALQRAHPGQRPVLFPSPYEAAGWSVISARRPAAQGARVRAAVGTRLGTTFELAGVEHPAFPQPERLLEVEAVPGLDDTKVQRLHGVARAALAGELDVARLHELGPEAAYEDVQHLPGIGPFYAGLIVLRAAGFADALAGMPEPKGATFAARYYGLPEPLGPDAFAELAERWRPFRTWAAVLIRLAGTRGTTISSEYRS